MSGNAFLHQALPTNTIGSDTTIPTFSEGIFHDTLARYETILTDTQRPLSETDYQALLYAWRRSASLVVQQQVRERERQRVSMLLLLSQLLPSLDVRTIHGTLQNALGQPRSDSLWELLLGASDYDWPQLVGDYTNVSNEAIDLELFLCLPSHLQAATRPLTSSRQRKRLKRNPGAVDSSASCWKTLLCYLLTSWTTESLQNMGLSWTVAEAQDRVRTYANLFGIWCNCTFLETGMLVYWIDYWRANREVCLPEDLHVHWLVQQLVHHKNFAPLYTLETASGLSFHALAACCAKIMCLKNDAGFADDQDAIQCARDLMLGFRVDTYISGLPNIPSVDTDDSLKPILSRRERLSRPGYPLSVMLEIELADDQLHQAIQQAHAMEKCVWLPRSEKNHAYHAIFEHLLATSHVFIDLRTRPQENLTNAFVPIVGTLGMEVFCELYHSLPNQLDGPQWNEHERRHVWKASRKSLLILLITRYSLQKGLELFEKYWPLPPMTLSQQEEWAAKLVDDPNPVPSSVPTSASGLPDYSALLQRPNPASQVLLIDRLDGAEQELVEVQDSDEGEDTSVEDGLQAEAEPLGGIDEPIELVESHEEDEAFSREDMRAEVESSEGNSEEEVGYDDESRPESEGSYHVEQEPAHVEIVEVGSQIGEDSHDGLKRSFSRHTSERKRKVPLFDGDETADEKSVAEVFESIASQLRDHSSPLLDAVDEQNEQLSVEVESSVDAESSTEDAENTPRRHTEEQRQEEIAVTGIIEENVNIEDRVSIKESEGNVMKGTEQEDSQGEAVDRGNLSKRQNRVSFLNSTSFDPGYFAEDSQAHSEEDDEEYRDEKGVAVTVENREAVIHVPKDRFEIGEVREEGSSHPFSSTLCELSLPDPGYEAENSHDESKNQRTRSHHHVGLPKAKETSVESDPGYEAEDSQAQTDEDEIEPIMDTKRNISSPDEKATPDVNIGDQVGPMSENAKLTDNSDPAYDAENSQDEPVGERNVVDTDTTEVASRDPLLHALTREQELEREEKCNDDLTFQTPHVEDNKAVAIHRQTDSPNRSNMSQFDAPSQVKENTGRIMSEMDEANHSHANDFSISSHPENSQKETHSQKSMLEYGHHSQIGFEMGSDIESRSDVSSAKELQKATDRPTAMPRNASTPANTISVVTEQAAVDHVPSEDEQGPLVDAGTHKRPSDSEILSTPRRPVLGRLDSTMAVADQGSQSSLSIESATALAATELDRLVVDRTPESTSAGTPVRERSSQTPARRTPLSSGKKSGRIVIYDPNEDSSTEPGMYAPDRGEIEQEEEVADNLSRSDRAEEIVDSRKARRSAGSLPATPDDKEAGFLLHDTHQTGTPDIDTVRQSQSLLRSGRLQRNTLLESDRQESDSESVASVVAKVLDDQVDWSSKTVIQLKQELESRGLSTRGKKAELIDRLTETTSVGKKDEGVQEETIKAESDTTSNHERLDEETSNDESSEGDTKVPTEQVNWSSRTVIQLKQELESLGLSTRGKKVELVDRISAAKSAEDEDEEAVDGTPEEAVPSELEDTDGEAVIDWSQKTVADLRRELSRRNLSTNGRKVELVARLTHGDEEVDGVSVASSESAGQDEGIDEGNGDVRIDWSKKTVAELRAELGYRGLSKDGLKADLVARMEHTTAGEKTVTPTKKPATRTNEETSVASSTRPGSGRRTRARDHEKEKQDDPVGIDYASVASSTARPSRNRTRAQANDKGSTTGTRASRRATIRRSKRTTR